MGSTTTESSVNVVGVVGNAFNSVTWSCVDITASVGSVPGCLEDGNVRVSSVDTVSVDGCPNIVVYITDASGSPDVLRVVSSSTVNMDVSGVVPVLTDTGRPRVSVSTDDADRARSTDSVVLVFEDGNTSGAVRAASVASLVEFEPSDPKVVCGNSVPTELRSSVLITALGVDVCRFGTNVFSVDIGTRSLTPTALSVVYVEVMFSVVY